MRIRLCVGSIRIWIRIRISVNTKKPRFRKKTAQRRACVCMHANSRWKCAVCAGGAYLHHVHTRVGRAHLGIFADFGREHEDQGDDEDCKKGRDIESPAVFHIAANETLEGRFKGREWRGER
jgi:hypothetical protein